MNSQQALSNKQIAKKLGFDAYKIFQAACFPLDSLEQNIYRFRCSRIAALKREAIWVLNENEPKQEYSWSKQGLRGSLVKIDMQQAAVECNMTLEELQDSLQRTAAATTVQAGLRSWFTRVLLLSCAEADYSIMSFEDSMSLRIPSRAAPTDDNANESDTDTVRPSSRYLSRRSKLPLLNFETLEVLREKYVAYCYYYDKQNLSLPLFPSYAATRIAAAYRGRLVRRYFARYKAAGCALDKLDANERWWIARYIPLSTSRQVNNIAANIIQRSWRRYYNRKIFQFYRDLVSFRNSGAPKQVLKFINPKEAELMDRASNVHVKIRLGGTAFPPTVYYKIFSHVGLVDVNAFAPREYWKNENKMPNPTEKHIKISNLHDAKDQKGWYQRYENNGWRPIMDKLWHSFHSEFNLEFNTSDFSAKKCSDTTIPFHYAKTQRREQLAQRKKARKVAWLQEMYKLKEVYDQDKEIEDEGDSVLRWSMELDFDKYIENWITLGTTLGSQDTVSN